MTESGAKRIENLNSPIPVLKIKLIIKKSRSSGFICEFCQTFKEEIILRLHELF